MKTNHRQYNAPPTAFAELGGIVIPSAGQVCCALRLLPHLVSLTFLHYYKSPVATALVCTLFCLRLVFRSLLCLM